MARKNKRNRYVSVYSDKEYQKDEEKFNQSIKKREINWGNFKRLLIRDLCLNTNILDTDSIGMIRLDDLSEALRNPAHNWKIILKVSEELMHCSPHYYRLNNMYSNMALFCWGVDLYDVKDNANIATVKKMYSSLSAKLESMNLQHEFSKIMRVIPYLDIYCGLVFENNTDYFIQKINYNICSIYETEDGLYNFIIDLECIPPNKIIGYPDYVQKAYANYHDSGNKKILRYYEPPADKQICIKLNYQWVYPFPMMIALIRDLLDLDIYKKLKLQSARTDNYKAIMMKVPIDESTVDKPLLTPDTLGVFAEINRDNMTDDIGLLYALGDGGEPISFKDSTNTRNNVQDSVSDIYDASGVTKELFNGSSSGTAVTFSIENNSGFIYSLYRQFERWTNRWIKARKYNKSTFKFSFYLLDITIFNRDIVSSRYKDAATLGVTCIDKWIASLGMTPSRVLGSYITHNDIFDFANNFKPLASSYNLSNESGRPTNASKNETLTESGEQTANDDENAKR